jgi:hypothetical protein
MKFEQQLNTSQQAEDPEADPKNDGRTDGVQQQDLERLEVTDREERMQDRDYWRSVTVAAETLAEL